MSAYEKLIFKLIPDEEGYPPVSTEAIWGERVGVDQYQVDNIPYYVYGVSKEDVVKVDNISGEHVGDHAGRTFYSEGLCRGAAPQIRSRTGDSRAGGSVLC